MMIVSHFSSCKTSHARREVITWERFCAWFDHPLEWRLNKHALPMYAPVAFTNDHRTKSNAERIYALIGDASVAVHPRARGRMIRAVGATTRGCLQEPSLAQASCLFTASCGSRTGSAKTLWATEACGRTRTSVAAWRRSTPR